MNERPIEIKGLSKVVELEHISIPNGSFQPVAVKHDQPQDGEVMTGGWNSGWEYPANSMDTFIIHHNYIVNSDQDGLYIGNTDPLGQRTLTRNGVSGITGIIPMAVNHVQIYNNHIENTGRTAIQVSRAETGDNRIYNNTIINSGYELNQFQGNHITIGGMTKNCQVYSNVVKKSFLYGCFDLGAGSNAIYNNRIDSAGMIPIFAWTKFKNFTSAQVDSMDAARSDFEVINDSFIRNTDLGGIYSIVSAPDTTYPYSTKRLTLKNNVVGLNTRTDGYDIGFVPWKGHLEDWLLTNEICNNKRMNGTEATIYRTAFGEETSWPLLRIVCLTLKRIAPGSTIKRKTF